MDKLWNIVVENLVDESLRLHGKVDLRRRNILNTLAKKEKMNEDSRKFIKDKTNFYLENII